MNLCMRTETMMVTTSCHLVYCGSFKLQDVGSVEKYHVLWFETCSFKLQDVGNVEILKDRVKNKQTKTDLQETQTPFSR